MSRLGGWLSGPKKRLLEWIQSFVKEYKGVKVEDLSMSFKDGLAICAIVHKFLPDKQKFDFDKLSADDPKGNLELGFKMAEKHLKIPQLLELKDILDVDEPDHTCTSVYLGQFFKKWKDKNKMNLFKVSDQDIKRMLEEKKKRRAERERKKKEMEGK